MRSVPVTAVEYFQFIRRGSYDVFINNFPGDFEEYSSRAFKTLRNDNEDFERTWSWQVEKFRKAFRKHFPPYDADEVLYDQELIQSFAGDRVDFGDELIYQIARTTSFPLVMTYDQDFNSFPDDLNILLFKF